MNICGLDIRRRGVFLQVLEFPAVSTKNSGKRPTLLNGDVDDGAWELIQRRISPMKIEIYLQFLACCLLRNTTFRHSWIYKLQAI